MENNHHLRATPFSDPNSYSLRFAWKEMLETKEQFSQRDLKDFKVQNCQDLSFHFSDFKYCVR